MPTPCRSHFKTAGPCPIYQFTNHSGLIAVGHGIKYTMFAGDAGKFSATNRIGLDGRRNNVFSRFESSQQMIDGNYRIAGAFNDDFYLIC